MIRIEKLNQFYGESHILWDVDLYIPAGSCTCLMGRNGVGKTTLLKTIMGTLPVASGHIEFDGASIDRHTAARRARAAGGARETGAHARDAHQTARDFLKA